MWEGINDYNIKRKSNELTPLIARNVKKSDLMGFMWTMAAASASKW